jgi:hypothetical protein
LEIAGRFETRMLSGTEEVQVFGGRIQYRERPELLGLDDDVVRLLGYQHRWQTDEKGEPIPLTIHRDPPIAGVIKILESHFSIYRPRSDLNINQKVSGGVTVVDRKAKPLPISVAQIAPPAHRSVEPIDETAIEVDDDDRLNEDNIDLSDILGEEPVAPVEMASEPEPEPELEPESAPAPQPDPPERGLTELERDLLDKLRAGPKNPRPSAIVNTGNASSRADDPPERFGA